MSGLATCSSRWRLPEDVDWPLVRERVSNCFGVAKYFRAWQIPPDLDCVKSLLSKELKRRSFDTFRITANRADKRFPKTSLDINRELGAYVEAITGAAVDLSNPGLEIFVDVIGKSILVYFDEMKAYGGLPLGVSGQTMTLLSGGIDSPVAAWHIMKRGSPTHLIHFHSYPLVDSSSIEKAEDLAMLLARYQYDSTLILAPFAEVQKRIIVSTPKSYRVVLYRRFMVRIAEEVAKRHGAIALVTGESLAQVSSQTMENIATIDEAGQIPILRPLIGFNKNEIVDVAREIGTFDVSILPDQDCCTLFVPPHPVINSDIKVVHRLEAELPVRELVNSVVEQVKIRHFSFPPNLPDTCAILTRVLGYRARFPSATINITLLPLACGEKKSVTASS